MWWCCHWWKYTGRFERFHLNFPLLNSHVQQSSWRLISVTTYGFWKVRVRPKKKKRKGALIVNVHGKQPYIVKENYFPIGNMYMGACAWTCMHTCPHVHTHPRAHIDVYLKMHKIYCIFDLSPQKEYTKGFFPYCLHGSKFWRGIMGQGGKLSTKWKTLFP